MRRIKSFLLQYKFFVLAACALGIAIDFFLSDFGLTSLFLIGFWALLIWFYKFEKRISVGGGLIFLFLCPFLLILKKESFAEKVAIWAYVFLVVGAAQMFIEYLKEEK